MKVNILLKFHLWFSDCSCMLPVLAHVFGIVGRIQEEPCHGWQKSGRTREAMTVTACILGWPSTKRWTPMATLLATLASLEACPETGDSMVAASQTTEMAMCGLPWNEHWSLVTGWAGKLRSLLVTGLTPFDGEAVVLQSKIRELEREVRTSQDAKVIVQEVVTTQVERCHGHYIAVGST